MTPAYHIEPSRYVPPGAKRLRESFGRAARGAITTPGVAPHKFRSARARPAVEASLERWFATKCSTPSVRSEGLDSYALKFVNPKRTLVMRLGPTTKFLGHAERGSRLAIGRTMARSVERLETPSNVSVRRDSRERPALFQSSWGHYA